MSIRTLNGLSGVNLNINTISSGKAIDIVATSSTTTNANVSMLINTAEQTTINDKDLV